MKKFSLNVVSFIVHGIVAIIVLISLMLLVLSGSGIIDAYGLKFLTISGFTVSLIAGLLAIIPSLLLFAITPLEVKYRSDGIFTEEERRKTRLVFINAICIEMFNFFLLFLTMGWIDIFGLSPKTPIKPEPIVLLIRVCGQIIALFLMHTAGVLSLQFQKDLFDHSTSKPAGYKPTLPRSAAEILTRVQDLSNLTPDEIADMLSRNRTKLNDEKNRIKNFNLIAFAGFDKEREIFERTRIEAIKKIEEAISLV